MKGARRAAEGPRVTRLLPQTRFGRQKRQPGGHRDNGPGCQRGERRALQGPGAGGLFLGLISTHVWAVFSRGGTNGKTSPEKALLGGPCPGGRTTRRDGAHRGRAAGASPALGRTDTGNGLRGRQGHRGHRRHRGHRKGRAQRRTGRRRNGGRPGAGREVGRDGVTSRRTGDSEQGAETPDPGLCQQHCCRLLLFNHMEVQSGSLYVVSLG